MDRLMAIPLKSSTIACYLHGSVLLLALTALWLCGLPLWLKSLLTMVMLAAARWQHKKQKQLSIRVIGFEQERWWALICNQKTPIELVNEQLVLPWLMVLNLREKDSGKKHVLTLWPDTAMADDLRRLRVWIRNG